MLEDGVKDLAEVLADAIDVFVERLPDTNAVNPRSSESEGADRSSV